MPSCQVAAEHVGRATRREGDDQGTGAGWGSSADWALAVPLQATVQGGQPGDGAATGDGQ
jgi:hypothetical protein